MHPPKTPCFILGPARVVAFPSRKSSLSAFLTSFVSHENSSFESTAYVVFLRVGHMKAFAYQARHHQVSNINPIQSNANKRAQVFLFTSIFYNITYKLKHLRFQLTRNENCKEHLDQASVCLDDF